MHVKAKFCYKMAGKGTRKIHFSPRHSEEFLGSCDRASWTKCEEREKNPTRCNNQMFIINFCLNMFQASLCPSSGEQRPCVTAYGVLRWFCWMWLVAVVGRCVVGCELCEGYCSPEDGHNDAQNMLRQKLIINIWSLHLVGFFSLFTQRTMLRQNSKSESVKPGIIDSYSKFMGSVDRANGALSPTLQISR